MMGDHQRSSVDDRRRVRILRSRGARAMGCGVPKRTTEREGHGRGLLTSESAILKVLANNTSLKGEKRGKRWGRRTGG